jgi:glucose/arabinose dehydrogenase
MPRLPGRLALASVSLALIAVACTGVSSPLPTSEPTLTPIETAAATSSPAATRAPIPTPTAAPTQGPTGRSLAGISVTSKPFARVGGTPLSFSAPEDGSGRLFIGDQEGRIWVANRDGAVAKNPAIDLSGQIRSGGEQGLLGVAVHPAFPVDPRVFVDFTNKDGNTVIASVALDPANANRLDATSFTQLLLVHQPFDNHNGGSLQFGPDGYLTIALGDGGSGGDPLRNGQNLTVLLGKILRIDIDGTSGTGPYAIPAENPFVTGGERPEIWLSGMRNPWRTSFDRKTGDFWIGDVGQDQWEEVDVIRAGTSGPLDLGWNVTEGAHCYNSRVCDQSRFVAPVAEYGHDVGCAIVGGFVYRGAAYPFLDGVYLFSDNCTSRIWAIDASSDGPATPVQVGQLDGNVSSFGEDDHGELYVLMLGGQVRRLIASAS